jgi:hypothetical protein
VEFLSGMRVSILATGISHSPNSETPSCACSTEEDKLEKVADRKLSSFTWVAAQGTITQISKLEDQAISNLDLLQLGLYNVKEE